MDKNMDKKTIPILKVQNDIIAIKGDIKNIKSDLSYIKN